jgi:hypothetical protein
MELLLGDAVLQPVKCIHRFRAMLFDSSVGNADSAVVINLTVFGVEDAPISVRGIQKWDTIFGIEKKPHHHSRLP